ncbi:Flagellar basal body-associated protein FliL [Sulfitobacter sp. THAF37]|uniref:flagellar basal body-associated FliL family protein n=1 Tax=Sulfitobacter sp. THAF37 TaxID=2587855 RepID=UPI0012A8A2AA|nr:flagellar basal body-associated FliL family protein [Sulfitobacter sp. THAF37]QFT58370.1 Flagellar basal body-associated protein FliL [Sulfitobacter sp. THAF37]
MLSKIIPVVLLLIGSGAGVGAGIFLRPPPEPPTETIAETTEEDHAEDPQPDPDAPAAEMEYVKLNNQFVVPVVQDKQVAALVVMSLSVEVPEGNKDAVFRREPKLRDVFLQVLFDHANIGGFNGAFTDGNNLAVLRSALRDVAQKALGKETVKDVLILEIARQDY